MDCKVNEKPTVAVWMLTYNHEDFIIKSIEGVMKQKTIYPLILFIAEDCSTDKTRSLVKRYAKKHPKKIKLFLAPQNLGVSNITGIHILNYKRVFESGAKYIAMCEGDDYWTDPFKIQKQVDFLENNNKYVLCGHPFKNKFPDNSESEVYYRKPMTLTLLFRNILSFNESEQELFGSAPNGDTVLRYLLRNYGAFAYVDSVEPAVRNISKNGVMGHLQLEEKYPRKIATFRALYEFHVDREDEKYFLNKMLRLKMKFRKITCNKNDDGYFKRLASLLEFVKTFDTFKYWVKIGLLDMKS